MNFTKSPFEAMMKKPSHIQTPPRPRHPRAPAVTAVHTGGASPVCPVTVSFWASRAGGDAVARELTREEKGKSVRW